MPTDKIEVVLGDTDLPPGPFSGGSAATASVIPAILQAVREAQQSIIDLAVKTPNSPFASHTPTIRRDTYKHAPLSFSHT